MAMGEVVVTVEAGVVDLVPECCNVPLPAGAVVEGVVVAGAFCGAEEFFGAPETD